MIRREKNEKEEEEDNERCDPRRTKTRGTTYVVVEQRDSPPLRCWHLLTSDVAAVAAADGERNADSGGAACG